MPIRNKTSPQNISSGVVSVNGKYGIVVISTQDLVYTNLIDPSITNVKQALDDLLYIYPKVILNSSIIAAEKGSAVNNVTLSWEINKSDNTIISQSLTDIGNIPIGTHTYNLSNLNLTINKSWTLTIDDGINTSDSSTSIEFLNKRYWGTSNNPYLDNLGILNLSGKEISNSFDMTKTFNCTGGKYIFFAFPSSNIGSPVFYIDGFNAPFIVTTQSFTNNSGYTEDYKIYRTANLQHYSSITVDIQTYIYYYLA